jgi:hypothetical protein
MTEVTTALWMRLHGEGLVADPQPPVRDQPPWYIHLLLGICAWFAAIFVMVFFGVLFHGLFRSSAGLLVVGGLCCGGAVAVLRGAGSKLFLAQFAVPFSLAGQGMIAAGVAQLSTRFEATGFGIGLLCAGTLMAALAAQAQHRFLSAGIALTGIVVVLGDLRVLALAAPLFAAVALAFWLGVRGSVPPSQYLALRPAMHAVNLALMMVLWFRNVPWYRGEATSSEWLLRAADVYDLLLALLWLGAVFGLLRLYRAPSALLWLGLAAIPTILLLPAPGVLAALMLLLLGFAAAERAVLATGLIGLLVYLARYYYEIDISLLAKSGVLVASGGVLLVLRMLLMQKREDVPG